MAPRIGQARKIVRGALLPNQVEAQRLAERIVPLPDGTGAIFYGMARRAIAREAQRQLAATNAFDPLAVAVSIRAYGKRTGRGPNDAAVREVAMIACQALDAFDRACRQAAEAECRAVLDAARATGR